MSTQNNTNTLTYRKNLHEESKNLHEGSKNLHEGRKNLHEGSSEHIGLVLLLGVPAWVDDGGVGLAPLHRILHCLWSQPLNVVCYIQGVCHLVRGSRGGLWGGAESTGALTVGRVITQLNPGVKVPK